MVTESPQKGYRTEFHCNHRNPHLALSQWRTLCGMERLHLGREIGHDIREVKALEEGHRGLQGRQWCAEQLLTLGAPAWAVEALQRTPDANWPVEVLG